MVFLDIKTKSWIIKDKVVPVIEDVPMKDMKWFRDKVKWSAEQEEKGTLSTTEALKVDDEWWDKVAEVGLGLTVEEIQDTGITEPDFRELMAEVYTFLVTCGTIKKSQAVRYIRSRDAKERTQAIRDYPELKDLIPLISLVRGGFGSWTEVIELKKTMGIDKLMEIQNILSILQQEEELDNANRSNRP